MKPLNRRRFLQLSLAVAGGTSVAKLPLRAAEPTAESQDRPILPVAAIVTEYRNKSHADVILGKILEGWEQDGGAGPALKIVGMYTDQVPKGDLSRALAEKHGFRIFDTIEEAITLGTGRVQVAGVISVGEHGNYPSTLDTGQKMYPRRRFFDAIAATFQKAGKVVPVFNDKHLAYNWKDAKHMYDTAREMGIPLLAGSSLPLAWRVPPLALPLGCELTEAIGTGYSSLESYGFHALEALQSMVERRTGGETGVASVQAVQGEEILQAEKAGRWSRALLEAAFATLPQSSDKRENGLGENAVFYLIEYRDGLRVAVAMRTARGREVTFAGRLKGENAPRATWFQTQDGKPFLHFANLVRAIEHTVRTGRPAYPVERTLLTTGMLDALLHSYAGGGKRIDTPHLAIRYQPADWPFAKGAAPPPRAN
jgi:hypothetical protein